MTCELSDDPNTVSSAWRFMIAEQADQCVCWLKAQGFDVLMVEAGPRITVRTSPLCDQLEGAVCAFSRGLHGEQRYKMAIRFDCEVRWLDVGGVQ